MKSNTNAIVLKAIIKQKTAATLTAIVAAVILPQLIHLAGIMSGTGKALGEIFLPMHLPIMLVGFLAGPSVGAIAGVLSPLVSFALTGMPSALALPFMCIELMSYGLFAGLLSKIKMPSIVKVIAVMFAGRAVRILAMLASIYILGNTKLSVISFITGITTGIIGMILQLTLIPLALRYVEKRGER